MSSREELLAASGAAMRDFMASAVFFQEAVAREAGLNGTDLQALGILVGDGPTTPGQLAQRTGITSGGAITLLIDRLERSGFAHRTRDQEDRRRVLITADAARVSDVLGPLYASVTHTWTEYLATLTADQLAFSVELLRHAVAVNRGEVERMARARQAARGPGT
jgi:hypothetical protein